MSLIYKKIPQIMKAVGAISKDRANEVQKYRFRGIEDMYNAFHPILVEHGVFCVPQALDVQTSEADGVNAKGDRKVTYRVVIKMQHSFYAEDGSCVNVTTVGEGIDTSDKASNKAMSAAMKYAFIELFSIPTEDVEDSDRGAPMPTISNVTRVGVVTPKPSPEPTSAPQCQLCGTALVLSANKISLYCPNFKDKSRGEHTKMPAPKASA